MIPYRKRFFLASSRRLRGAIDHLELLIQRRNSELVGQGLLFEVVRWELLLHSIHPEGVQERFNQELEKCDVAVVLIDTGVGQYTKAELEFAVRRCARGLKPRHVLVYFEAKYPASEAAKLRETVIGAGQLAERFKDRVQLENLVSTQLDALMDEYRDELHNLQGADQDESTVFLVRCLYDLLQTYDHELDFLQRNLGVEQPLLAAPTSLVKVARELRFHSLRSHNDVPLVGLIMQRHPHHDVRLQARAMLGSIEKPNVICTSREVMRKYGATIGSIAAQQNARLFRESAAAGETPHEYYRNVRESVREANAVIGIIGDGFGKPIGNASHVEIALLYALALNVRWTLLFTPATLGKTTARRVEAFSAHLKPGTVIPYENPLVLEVKLKDQLLSIMGGTG